MGQDYATRKLAKKKWKKMGKALAGKEGVAKRERKKSNAPRRLCQGMCYNKAPVLTEEDRRWNGREDSDDSDVAQVRRARRDQRFATGPDPHRPMVSALHVVTQLGMQG